MRVAVAGGGTMGNGIAQVFATAGHSVVLLDLDEERLNRARDAVATSLDRIVKKGGLAEADRQKVLDRIAGTTRPAALADCELVVEAVVEDLAVKRELFHALSR